MLVSLLKSYQPKLQMSMKDDFVVLMSNLKCSRESAQHLSPLIIKASHLIAFQFHLDKSCLRDISCYIQRYQQTLGVFCQKEMVNGA